MESTVDALDVAADKVQSWSDIDASTVYYSETLDSLVLFSRQTSLMSTQQLDFSNDTFGFRRGCTEAPPRRNTATPNGRAMVNPLRSWSRQRTDIPVGYWVFDLDGNRRPARPDDDSLAANVFSDHSDLNGLQTSAIMEHDEFQSMVSEVVAESKFSVTVADPRLPDAPLIAVSTAFEDMTGFTRTEILGNNCRFLNRGCDLDFETSAALRQACKKGTPFTAVLTNRRKSGELFLNLLDLRGMTVARNERSGEELWFVIGIQADVTNVAEHEMPENHLEQFNQIAKSIRRKLTDKIAAMAISGALDSKKASAKAREGIQIALIDPTDAAGDTWHVLPMPKWRPSEAASADTLTSLPLVTDDDNMPLAPSSPYESECFDRLPSCSTSQEPLESNFGSQGSKSSCSSLQTLESDCDSQGSSFQAGREGLLARRAISPRSSPALSLDRYSLRGQLVQTTLVLGTLGLLLGFVGKHAPRCK